MIAQQCLEESGRLVLEVLQHDRVRTPLLQTFDAIAEFHRSIAQHGPGSPVLPGQFAVQRRHVVTFPGRARSDREQMDIPVLEGFSSRWQLRGPHAQHDQRLLGANLVGVIGHPNPIVSRFEGFPQDRHADAQKPSANRCPMGKLLLYPKPLPHNLQNALGRTQTDNPRQIHRQTNHAATKLVALPRQILRQAAFPLGLLSVLVCEALPLLLQRRFPPSAAGFPRPGERSSPWRP